MNYRHAYHAGNFADVHKHSLLLLLLAHLLRKDTPLRVIDTHAGIGLYDLDGEEARKTAEADEGILRLLAHPAPHPLLESYLDAVRRANPAATGSDPASLTRYPGSPKLLRGLLRLGDHLDLAEKHPQDAQTLQRRFAGDRLTRIHAGEDGYGLLKSQLPPRERRALVLIDPPFEQPDEFAQMLRSLREALRRFPTGVYALWYPIKDPQQANRFLAELSGLGRPVLTADLYRLPPDRRDRLNGSGLAIINPPWQFDQQAAELLPWLAEALRLSGPTGVRWLVAAP